MNAWIKSWGVILALSPGIDLAIANDGLCQEVEALQKMVHQVPLSLFENYHGQDWEEFMRISSSHWGDSTTSLTEKFDSILGKEGKLTKFISDVFFNDEKSVRLFKEAYIEYQCRFLIAHFNAHSKNSYANVFRCPHEIDVITKLEMYGLKNEIPLLRYYHEKLGYTESDFTTNVEKMNEALAGKLQDQEEKEIKECLEREEREIKERTDKDEQERLSKIPPPPPLPPLFISTVRIKTPLSPASPLSIKWVTKIGGGPKVSSSQLQAGIKGLKRVDPSDLIKPIPTNDFAALLFERMEKRRGAIKGYEKTEDTDEEEKGE